MRLRAVILLAVLALAVGCAPTPLPTPIAPYQSRNVGVMVTGQVVLASVQVKATAGHAHPDIVGICATDTNGVPVDWPAGDRELTPVWVTVSSTRKFPPGDYTARVCITSGGRDQQVDGPTETFTVR